MRDRQSFIIHPPLGKTNCKYTGIFDFTSHNELISTRDVQQKYSVVSTVFHFFFTFSCITFILWFFFFPFLFYSFTFRVSYLYFQICKGIFFFLTFWSIIARLFLLIQKGKRKESKGNIRLKIKNGHWIFLRAYNNKNTII